MEAMSQMGRLLVKTGDICYVENIMSFANDGADGKYTPKPGTESTDTVTGASHYFVLEDGGYSRILGWTTTGATQEVTGGCYG